MKKLLLCAMIAMSVFSAMAELGGDGYYRVQNAVTKRYAYLLDNKAFKNVSATTVDVQAIELYLGFLKASSDPATVFYINKNNSSSSKYEYDIAGQGTSLYSFLNEYMKVITGKVIDGEQSYYAYGTSSIGSKYLGDRRSDPNAEKGLASVDTSGDIRLWYIHPIVADSPDSYFGVAPTLTCNGKYYYAMFASFPFDAFSDGMKFFTVTKVNPRKDSPAVCLKELNGVVPAGTPVIIECSNPLPSNNRLNIAPAGTTADVSGNLLKGVYFNNDDVIHKNQTAYDSKTMRILAVKDGKLVFDVADIDYLPRNQAYLQLTEDDQYKVGCYQLLSEDEYEDIYNSVGVIDALEFVDVYTADGRLVKACVAKQDVSSLGAGLYILHGKGLTEKIIVR